MEDSDRMSRRKFLGVAAGGLATGLNIEAAHAQQRKEASPEASVSRGDKELKSNREVIVGERLNIREAIERANGRSIVVGEDHSDRRALQVVLRLMRAAHAAGYRRLGIEIAEEGFPMDGYRWGLKDELNYVRSIGDEAPTEYDPTSPMAPDKTGHKPRFNRFWHEQLGLKLGWDIFPIDPNYNYKQGQVVPFDETHAIRDPAIARLIRELGPMIAIVGSYHLKGVHDNLGDEAFFVNTSPFKRGESAEMKLVGIDRARFAMKTPLLRDS